jgi:5-aminopentanamidase
MGSNLTNGWKLAVVQMASGPNVRENVGRTIAALGEAAELGAKLAVLPECVLSGYMYEDRRAAAEHSVRLNGQELTEIAETCAELDMHAVIGYLENDGAGGLYNSAVLIDDRGERVANYRKTHLPCLGVDRFVDEGRSTPPVVPTRLGRIGIAICYDLRFPEVARVLALAGADVIAQPSTWPSAARILADHFAVVRACENRVYVAVANRHDTEAGVKFIGLSRVVDPTGRTVAEADEDYPAVLVADIDCSASREKRIVTVPREYEVSLFADRRPDLYASIAEQSPNS